MNRKVLHFRADEQQLRLFDPVPELAGGLVNYVHAYFELGQNWTDFDVVKALWVRGSVTEPAELEDGFCAVPESILAHKGRIEVNLVGYNKHGGILVERLTSYTITAAEITAEAKTNGDEPGVIRV